MRLRRDKTHFLHRSVDSSSQTEVENSRPPPPPPPLPCLVYTHTLQTLPAKCHLHGYNPFPGLSSGCRLPRVIVPAAGNAVPIALFTLPSRAEGGTCLFNTDTTHPNFKESHQQASVIKRSELCDYINLNYLKDTNTLSLIIQVLIITSRVDSFTPDYLFSFINCHVALNTHFSLAQRQLG